MHELAHANHDRQRRDHGEGAEYRELRRDGRVGQRHRDERSEQEARQRARIESFVLAEESVVPGDRALVLIETANEQYPVTVRSVEADGSVICVRWDADELPATLRELGGD